MTLEFASQFGCYKNEKKKQSFHVINKKVI